MCSLAYECNSLLSIKLRGNDANVQWYESRSSHICSSISPPSLFCSQSAAATPKIPTTPAIPAVIAPVCFAAPPLDNLEDAVEPPAAVAELVPEVDIPVLLPVELVPVIDPVDIALAFLVTLFNSAAAVAMPANPVYVCR